VFVSRPSACTNKSIFASIRSPPTVIRPRWTLSGWEFP
jgi:hypothetical protein